MAAPGSSRTTCAASTDRNQSSASAHLSSLPRLHWQDVNAVSQAILADLRTPAASTDKQGDAPSNLMQSIVGTDIASNGTSDSPVQPPTPSAPQSQLHVSRPSWLQPVIALCLQVRQAYQRRQQRQAFPQHAISNMASMASTVAQPHPVPGPALISGAPARSDFSLPPRNLGTVGARVEAAPKLLATGLNTLTATAEMPVSGSEGAVRLAAHAAHTDDRIQKKPTLDPNLELWLRTQSRLQPPVQRHQPQVQQQFSRCVRVKRAYPISPTTSVAWDKQHLQQHLPINRVANLAGRQNSEPLSQLSTAQVAGIYAAAKAAAKAAATARTAATRQNMQVAGQQQPQVPQQQEQHLSCMPMQLQPQQQQTYSGARRRLFF